MRPRQGKTQPTTSTVQFRQQCCNSGPVAEAAASGTPRTPKASDDDQDHTTLI